MIKKVIFAIVGFYFLTLLQSSFFVHFSNYTPNFVLIAVVLINLFEKQKNNFGIVSSLIGGFFLDVFFSTNIGYYLLISFLISIFIKFIFKKYVWQT